MPKTMLMPKIGVNMTDALVVKWMVKEGDTIALDQHIMDAETDKAVQEINATAGGVVVKILADELERVVCRQPILLLAEPEEKVEAAYIEKIVADLRQGGNSGEPAQTGAPAAPAAAPASASPPKAGERVRISPLARKMAKEMSIDYQQVAHAGPGGRIVKADLMGYADTAKPDSPGPAAQKIPLAGARRVIADKMTDSVLTKPSVALTLHADAGALISWRGKMKESGRDVKYDAMLAAITAKALREFPIINSRIEGDEIHIIEEVNIGIAVDTEKGLMVPVIRDADKKGVAAISSELVSRVRQIKDGQTDLKAISGGTFTITNLGMFGIEQFDAIINPPECCILAVGAMIKEPAVKNDEIVIATRIQLTLVFDHRIVDGAPAAKFLQRIKKLVEDPMELLS